MSIESGQRNYPGLDLIRLTAAMMVAAFHLGWWWWRDDPNRLVPELAPIASSGWVGVPIFFVISGFVIAFSAGGRSASDFAKSRAARLYPASWICASLTFVAVPTPLGDYLRAMVLSPIGPWVSGVYWTLAIEMIFYLLVAISLVKRWNLGRVALGLGYCSTAFWALRDASRALGNPVAFAWIDNYSGYLLLHDGTFFALGILLNERRHRVSALIFLASGFVAVVAGYKGLSPPGASLIVAPLIWLLSVGLIAVSVFRNDQVTALVKRLPTRTIGLMTYPLYLLHMDIGHAIMLKVSNPLLAFALGIAAAILLALAVLPIERWIRRLVFGAM